MQNIFQTLLSSFGKEEPFTACLALFLERNRDFRFTFLEWLETIIPETLTGYEWEISTEVSKPSLYKEARLDMVLAHPNIELWFEHKIDAPLGKRPSNADNKVEVDQIRKYLDAASRIMTKTNPANQEACWPENGPAKGQPRVILFCISARGVHLQTNEYVDRIYSKQSPYGFALADDGIQLRWRDFHPLATSSLKDTLAGKYGILEAMLSEQFLQYWQSIDGIWRQTKFNDNWLKLIPPKETLSSSNMAPFANYMMGLEKLLVSKLGWQVKEHWDGGITVVFDPGLSDVENITLRAIRSIEQIPNYKPRLGTEVVSIGIRFSPGVNVTQPIKSQMTHADHPGQIVSSKTNKKTVITIYTGLNDWNEVHTKTWRYQQVVEAFAAGLHMAALATGITIVGLEKI
tara:strand:+ start:290 stop:1498 length:1209 start_codon:yes stop_codon:yes gene_type:complete